MYYLQSRYYDPVTGRFINADIYFDTGISVLSTNMFAYCENNCINNIDSEGYAPKNLEAYVKKLKNRTSFGPWQLNLKVKGNNITISAGFVYFGDLAYKKKGSKTYKQLFLDGIKKYWNGKYKVYGYNVKLNVTFNNAVRNKINVVINNRLGVSNVSRIGRWSCTNPGKLTIYKGDSRTNYTYTTDEFQRVSAHEFGHILGVGDLYNKSNKIIKKYSYKGNYSMMGHQWKASHINNYDLQKVLYAFMNNKSQEWK